VADAPPPMSKGERSRILREGALRYASLAATLGLSEDEAVDGLRAAFKKQKGIPS